MKVTALQLFGKFLSQMFLAFFGVALLFATIETFMVLNIVSWGCLVLAQSVAWWYYWKVVLMTPEEWVREK